MDEIFKDLPKSDIADDIPIVEYDEMTMTMIQH